MYKIAINQPNTIPFVMVNASGTEVTGLGTTFVVSVSKNGGAFNAGAGAKSEIGSGWYQYIATAGECDTAGPLSIKITGAGCLQQNLVYPIETVMANAIKFTYTLTSSVGGAPIVGAFVWFTTDLNGQNIVASGTTDVMGQVSFYLSTGTYYVWRSKDGFSFTNPDTEVVS
jgi:hypothetical protein